MKKNILVSRAFPFLPLGISRTPSSTNDRGSNNGGSTNDEHTDGHIWGSAGSAGEPIPPSREIWDLKLHLHWSIYYVLFHVMLILYCWWHCQKSGGINVINYLISYFSHFIPLKVVYCRKCCVTLCILDEIMVVSRVGWKHQCFHPTSIHIYS